MFSLTSGQLVAIAIGLGSVGGWFALYGLALVVSRPARPAPLPATQDLPGSEPPAVVSLLAGDWDLSEDAAESTLIDLAARKYLEFRQPGNDPMQTTIHVKQPNPTGLNRYEQRIFDRVAGLAVGGVVPLPALTFRDQGQATTFEKRLRAEVVADARARGLSRRRFGPAILAMLTVAAIVAGGGLAAAVFLLARHGSDGSGGAVKGAGFTWFFAAAILVGFGHRPIGERDTPAGREAAAKWFGVRDWLARTEAFGDLPPSAVAVWDRYLSYGDALGTTRVCAAVIDLGMGNRKRVWSSYGDTWHRVRVRYPRLWPRYGRTARYLIVRGVLLGGLGFLLLYYWAKGVAAALKEPAIGESHAAQFAGSVKSIGLAIGTVLFVYGLYLLVRTIIDLAVPAQITGQVLWKQVWRSNSGGENSPPVPWLHYVAVDDGSGDRTTAWGLPSEIAGRAVDGDTVKLSARRWSRRVTELSVVQQGTGRRWRDAGSANNQTEAMIAKAMSLPEARVSADADPFDEIVGAAAGAGAGAVLGLLGGMVRAPSIPAADLLTAYEVSSALGMAVTPHAVGGDNQPVPVQQVQFRDPGGKPVLMLMAAGGMVGQLAVRARRRGQPLPGIGDEAFTGDGWAVGRRGDTVVTIALTGTGKRAEARNLHWLLATAVGRLTAAPSSTT
jgi:Predicted membrane protein (DUF2207)